MTLKEQWHLAGLVPVITWKGTITRMKKEHEKKHRTIANTCRVSMHVHMISVWSDRLFTTPPSRALPFAAGESGGGGAVASRRLMTRRRRGTEEAAERAESPTADGAPTRRSIRQYSTEGRRDLPSDTVGRGGAPQGAGRGRHRGQGIYWDSRSDRLDKLGHST